MSDPRYSHHFPLQPPGRTPLINLLPSYPDFPQSRVYYKIKVDTFSKKTENKRIISQAKSSAISSLPYFAHLMSILINEKFFLCTC